MVKYFLLILSIILVSCIPYYFDEYGNSIPKNPRYSLKDKKGFTIPDNLDTFNLYKKYIVDHYCPIKIKIGFLIFVSC